MTSDARPFHRGLTATLVVDAAVELTQESHLLSWSIRDLSKRLDAKPSSIYHHVGGKEALCKAVVSRVAATMVEPDPDLDWKEWFRKLLLSSATETMKHPGVSHWMLMHGPSTESLLPIMNNGLNTLKRAGFGLSAHRAFAHIMNTFTMTISMGDDRLREGDDGPRDHATMAQDFQQASAGASTSQEFDDTMIQPFAAGGSTADQARLDYLHWALEITMAGLESWLAAGCPPSGASGLAQPT